MLYDFGDGNGLVEASFHRNGGGVVAKTAKVEETAFLDRGCVVFGHACVTDRVRIVGYCRISGDDLPGGISTLLEDDVFVSGNVVVEGHVLMRDHAQARNHAKLSGSVAMMHHSQIGDRATVAGQVQMCDHSYVYEDSTVIGDDELITLSVRDFINGDRILRNMKEVHSVSGRPVRKRRGLRKQPVQEVVRPVESTVKRRMSLMPTCQDLALINMSSCGDRIAAVG